MDWQKTAENMEKRGFTVRHYATGAEAAEALCRPVVEEICRRYGDVVYGADVDRKAGGRRVYRLRPGPQLG